MSAHEDIDPSALGPNMWLIDEMYRALPGGSRSGVDERWKRVLRGLHAHPRAEGNGPRVHAGGEPGRRLRQRSPRRRSGPARGLRPTAAAGRGRAAPEGAERIRFGAERVVRNMERQPARSPRRPPFRFVPAKLLEENRRVINRWLRPAGAVARSASPTWSAGPWSGRCEAVPVMTSSYRDVEGDPYVVRRESVNLGLAVDVQKEDGARTLFVPNIKGADRDGLRPVLVGVRGGHPQGPHQQAQPRRLRRHHRHALQSRAPSAPSSRSPG